MHSKNMCTNMQEDFRLACAILSSFTLYGSQLPPYSLNVAGSCYDTSGFLCLEQSQQGLQ